MAHQTNSSRARGSKRWAARSLATLACGTLISGAAMTSVASAEAESEGTQRRNPASGFGVAKCPQADGQSRTTKKIVKIMYNAWASPQSPKGWESHDEDWLNIEIPFIATASAYIVSPEAKWKVGTKTRSAQNSGQILIDGDGNGILLKYQYDKFPVSTMKIRGPWSDLRLIAPASASGHYESGNLKSTLLYGITTAGDLVQMPVTWSSRAVPSVGKQTVLASGFADWTTLEFNAWRGKNWVPAQDELVGTTKSGQFMQVQINRGDRPTVATKVLAKSGYSGVTSMTRSTCSGEEKPVVWVLQRSDGSALSYTDPDWSDSSLKGIKRTVAPSKLPASVNIL